MILWFKNGLLKAALIEELPKVFMFEGRRFVPMNVSLGDADCLRNEESKRHAKHLLDRVTTAAVS
jgi:hypothetical protein